MSRDEIIAMAKEAGIQEAFYIPEELERFYQLAFAAGAAYEREACAKMCDEPSYMQQRAKTSAECAQAIRARTQSTN